MSEPSYIFDITTEQFDTYVVQNSHKVPVLVDFWAQWCEPCKQLGPLLEKIVTEYEGSLLLAKIDADAEKALVQAQGIRSLPTVKLIKEGQLVDEFIGIKTEAELREFLDQYIQRETHTRIDEAIEAQQQGDFLQAQSLLQQHIQEHPNDAIAHAHLARVLVQQGQAENAYTLLTQLPEALRNEQEIIALIGQIEFAKSAALFPDSQALQERLEQDANDSEARFYLACNYMAKNQIEQGFDEFLRLLMRDKTYNNNGAQEAMLHGFDMLGNQHPLTQKYRRKMFSMLH